MNKVFSIPLVMLIISAISIIVLLIYVLRIKNKNRLQKIFCMDLISVLIICTGVIAQSLLSTIFNFEAYTFENFIYIGTCFLPVFLLLTGKAISNKQKSISGKYYLLFIVPVISLLVLWTNSFHHLFYVDYHYIDMNATTYGNYFYIHTVYSYSLLLLSIIIMLNSSLDNSGFFSKQALMIILGSLFPIVANVLGTLKIIPMSVYVTPISFAFSMLCFAIAIFKFEFLGISPIALRIIVDQISDSYIVLNRSYLIIDVNRTFYNTFKIHTELQNKDFFGIIGDGKKYGVRPQKLRVIIDGLITKDASYKKEIYVKSLNKYFQVELTSLFNKDKFLGTLIIFKDITVHKEDIQKIQDNQNILMERERLATLGQMVGGIAHNLKTPIMSIAGAMEGLKDLVVEYDKSVDDPEVTKEDHHSIAHDMLEWIDKVNSYDSYMSDIITAVKGQAVNFTDSSSEKFTIDELLKRVNILMRHELKNALITLNVDCRINENTKITGNVNSLVQVVNNLISNAIQSYNNNLTSGDSTNSTEKYIDLTIFEKDNNIVISVKDYGCGIPEDVQKKLFNQMITTKGHNGTGLGLFMSYSTIKGHFNGDLSFTSKVGKGTTFNIVLPMQ